MAAFWVTAIGYYRMKSKILAVLPSMRFGQSRNLGPARVREGQDKTWLEFVKKDNGREKFGRTDFSVIDS